MMEIIDTTLADVKIIKPKLWRDSRGWFYESWRLDKYKEAGIKADFVQDNMSKSTKGVLRGLHYQKPNTQAKLVSVIDGEIWDVIVDLRRSSPTFGKWEGFYLDGVEKTQLFVPQGFAHGFCVLSEICVFQYKCDDLYNPSAEHGIMWNDPKLAIPWPVAEPIISDKDGRHPRFDELTKDELFD